MRPDIKCSGCSRKIDPRAITLQLLPPAATMPHSSMAEPLVTCSLFLHAGGSYIVEVLPDSPWFPQSLSPLFRPRPLKSDMDLKDMLGFERRSCVRG